MIELNIIQGEIIKKILKKLLSTNPTIKDIKSFGKQMIEIDSKSF